MAARTLNDDFADDLADTFLDTDECGEWVTYFPTGGGPSRRVVALISDVVSRDEARGVLRKELHTVSVLVQKDQTHAKGGVTEPQCTERGADTLERDSEPNVRYAFTARVIASDSVSWTLEFERRVLKAVGTEHREG